MKKILLLVIHEISEDSDEAAQPCSFARTSTAQHKAGTQMKVKADQNLGL